MASGTNILELVIAQVIEWVKNLPLNEHESLTESINTLDTKWEIESEQPPTTQDMSPIIRPEVQPLEMPMSHFPLSKTKLSFVIDKTQDTILELLITMAEIYLAQKKCP